MSYFITVTDEQGVLLGRKRLDGLNLREQGDIVAAGEAVADCMGGDAMTACAALPYVEDDD